MDGYRYNLIGNINENEYSWRERKRKREESWLFGCYLRFLSFEFFKRQTGYIDIKGVYKDTNKNQVDCYGL